MLMIKDLRPTNIKLASYAADRSETDQDYFEIFVK